MNIPQNLSGNRSTLYAQPLEQNLSGNTLSTPTNNSSFNNNNYRSNTKLPQTDSTISATTTAQKPTPDAYRGFKCTPTLGWLALFNVIIALVIILCALLFANHDDKQSFFWNTPRSHAIDANPNTPSKTPYIDNNNVPVAPSNGDNNNNGNKPDSSIRRNDDDDDQDHNSGGNGDESSPPPGCPVMCPMIWEPVCGSNGQTFSNLCLLEAENKCTWDIIKGRVQPITKAHDGECLQNGGDGSVSGGTDRHSRWETI